MYFNIFPGSHWYFQNENVLFKLFGNYSAYQNQSIDADLAEMDASYCNLVKKEKRYH